MTTNLRQLRIVQRLAAWKVRDFVEIFVLFNLACLGGDIFVAHSYNHFANRAEWIPLGFSIIAPVVLLAAIAMGGLAPAKGLARWLGMLIGWGSIVLGIAGLLLHLNSQFFEQQTLKSLVYTAPFAAPLAYTGLGLILLLNRMVDADTPQWAAWVLLLASGGFIGNFILSLADHAQNGFYHWTEWIPVVASALAAAFLCLPLWAQTTATFLKSCIGLMVLQILVGLLGFALHVRANLHGPSDQLRDNFIYGAPAFAPLLFPNLAILGGLGAWSMTLSQRRNVST